MSSQPSRLKVAWCLFILVSGNCLSISLNSILSHLSILIKLALESRQLYLFVSRITISSHTRCCSDTSEFRGMHRISTFCFCCPNRVYFAIQILSMRPVLDLCALRQPSSPGNTMLDFITIGLYTLALKLIIVSTTAMHPHNSPRTFPGKNMKGATNSQRNRDVNQQTLMCFISCRRLLELS